MAEGENVSSYLSPEYLRVSENNETDWNWNFEFRFLIPSRYPHIQAHITWYSRVVTHLGSDQVRYCLTPVIRNGVST